MEEPTGHEETNYELSTSTTGGIKQRACPCCKKLFKMERLGLHFKQKHPTEYNEFFTVARLTTAIQEKKLIAFTVEYEEKNIDFLHCFACCSIRTTDRNHFKDKDAHLAEHLEIAEKMISKKTGVAFIPVNVTEIEKLKRKIDNISRKLAQQEKYCGEEHEQYDTHNALREKEIHELKLRNEELEKELDEEKNTATNRGKRIQQLETYIKIMSSQCKSLDDGVGSLYSTTNQAAFNSFTKKLSDFIHTIKECANS